MMMRAKSKPKSIDDYLSTIPDDQRAALQRVRKIVKAAVPRAEECISYQMPAFRADGRVFMWFAAAKNHCSIYPGGIVNEFKNDLEAFDVSKGTVRFQPKKPLPAVLIRKLIKARLAIDRAK
jgi:uncharacterized protein YdhG (YjbR/CyaY superfamily)